MAVSESPVPPMLQGLTRTANASRSAAAAALAGGIIAASGRPHSIAEAIELYQNVHFALFPEPNRASYREWLATKKDDVVGARHT
jgi:hypothetical protein